MSKEATTDHPVHPLIRQRWSPRAFADRPVREEDLTSLLEAARWAPSANNEQPWSFVVARRGDPEFARVVSWLVPGNQAWAQNAAVLLVSLARTHFAHTGKPNRHAFHDVGAATSQLTTQATSLGLAVHPMAGIEVERIREELKLPEGLEPVAAIAIGYLGNPDLLPERLRERELAPRTRKSFDEMVFPIPPPG